jgi:hypothetical protein
MPALAPGARVVFVLGVLPPEVATEEDREARRASPASSATPRARTPATAN